MIRACALQSFLHHGDRRDGHRDRLLPSTCDLLLRILLLWCGLCWRVMLCRGRSPLRDHRARLLPST